MKKVSASTKTPPWKKPAPNGRHRTTLTKEEKAMAKTRAENAGRHYPNLIDNMAIIRKRNKK